MIDDTLRHPIGSGTVLVLLIATLASLAMCQPEGNNAMSNNDELAFIITPRSERVFAGASIVLDLAVENRSGRAVSFPNPMFPSSPQPVYRLKRPDGEEIELTPRNMAGNGAPESETKPVTLVTLQPNEGWEGDMTLNNFTDMSLPGVYQLTGRITWEDVSIDAKPVTITVLETRPEELSIAFGIDDDGSMFCEAMLLQRSPDTLEAVAALLREIDPVLGEMKVMNYIPRGAVPRNTRMILGPYANYVDLVLRWTVAVTGDGFRVSNNSGDGVCDVGCDEPIALALTPVTKRDRSLTLLAVSAGPEPGLWQARLGSPDSMPATASLTRITDLTAPPLSVTAVLGPENQGSPILVAATAVDDSGTTLDVYRLVEGGSPQKESRHFPDVRALPGLGGHIDTKGDVRFGFLAVKPGDPEQLAFVETAGKLEDKVLAESHTAEAFDRAEITGDVRVQYYDRSPSDTRRAVAYQTDDDSLFVLEDDGRPRAAYSDLPRYARWGLAPGRDTWYVAFTDTGGVTVGPL